MKPPDYRIFVTTSDKYLPALLPLAWLLRKYWQPCPQVVIGGFTPPDFDLPDIFTFHSIGKAVDYPVNKWSDGVLDFVRAMPDDVFMLLLEDMWPVRGVNGHAVQVLVDYMRQFEYVARIDLTGDRLYAHGMQDYGTVAHLDLIISMPGSPYHLSMMPGLWRKQHLLSTFVPGENPWEVEMQGTPRLSFNRDIIVLGTRQWPYRNCLAFRGGEPGKFAKEEITKVSPSDMVTMRALGYLKPWEGE